MMYHTPVRSSIWRTNIWLLLGVALILFIALGIRHAFGLFLTPMSFAFGWGREVFAFAIALQNLVWGLTQPLAGAVADRFGARWTIFTGGVLYTAGLVLIGFADSSWMLSLSSGLLVGMGLSGVSYSVLFGVIGRAVPEEKRSVAMGITAAVGSFGQFAMLPGTLGLMEWLGWAGALLALGLLSALMLPLTAMIHDHPVPRHEPTQTLRAALREAFGHRGFWLLAWGFFVCGFQVIFISVHIPSYLIDQSLPVVAGTTVLALVGLFNVFGSYSAGWLGGRYSKPRLLSVIYLSRAVAIVLFITLPVSTWTAYVFAMVMGLLWLSTVPLTNGVVATLFGVRNLSMLGGIVFLMHQIGAFLGGWLGGYLYDHTGSYDRVWYLCIGLSLIAAALNWPIKEQPVTRLQGASA